MFKKITKFALLGALTIQFAAFAGFAPSNFSTSWNPNSLFVTADNGSITTGTITVTSNYVSNGGNGNGGQRPFEVNYTSNNITPLVLNPTKFIHNAAVGSNVTSVIGYSIDLTTNTFVGTVLGSVKILTNPNIYNYNGNMPFTIVTKNPVRPFVTLWDLSISGGSFTQLKFKATTNGDVSYNWATYPIATATGSGTFNGNASITGLPSNATISLSIDGANLQAVQLNSFGDQKRLIDITQWGTVAWTSMEYAFNSCSNLQISATDVPNLSGVTNMSLMLNSCTKLNSIPNMDSWNTGNVTNLSNMFGSCPAFNQSIGGWNTANVTNMSQMFFNASSFNQSIGGWNTANVTDMSAMFYNASAFNQPIGGWNTTNVTDMSSMFYNASAFNQSIGGWSTDNVTDMTGMFTSTTGFNQPLNNWNVSNVGDMSNMFKNASVFNQSLAAWGTMLNSNVILNQFLDNSGLSAANYDAILQGFSATTVTGRMMNAVGLKYCTGASARGILTSATGKNWTITDGGALPTVAINTQPTSQTVCGGNVANFTVSALGANLTYAWSNGLSTSKIMNTSVAGTNYTVTVSGACGIPVISSVVGLTVNAPTSIVIQPQGGTYCAGSVGTISVSALGTNLSYLWSFGSPLRENTGPANLSDNGDKYVTVTGTCGIVVSNAATFIINSLTTITSPPLSQTVCGGNTASFNVSATGANIDYLWSTGEAIHTITKSLTGTYLVTATGLCGNATASAILTVNDCTSTVTSVSITDISVSASLTSITSPILVSILGTGFVNGATVTVGGVVLTDVLVSGNVLTGMIPAGAVIINPGSPSISIQNPNQSPSVGVSVTPTVVSGVNSIFSIQNSLLNIYPNPSTGSFTIDAPLYTTAEIINLLGEVIQKVTLTDKVQVNIATKGFYLVRLYSNTDSKLVKINIE